MNNVVSRFLLQARGIVVALALGMVSGSAQAITWCHDYSYYRASEFALGKGKDLNNLSPVALKSRLQVLGYRRIAILKPGETADLRRGDVIIIGNAEDNQEEDHSGFVTDNAGNIDHLIQKFKESGKPYTFAELATVYDPVFESLLVRRNWTVRDLRERKRKVNGVESDSIYKQKTFLVYRRTLDQNSVVGVWVAKERAKSPPALSSRKDAMGLPRCVPLEIKFEKGLIRYQRKVAPSGAAVDITLAFIPPPKVLLEGEQVVFQAEWSVAPATTDFLDDELNVFARGNGLKTVSRNFMVFLDQENYTLRVSLSDPKKVNTSVKNAKGEMVPNAPPRVGRIVFDWPLLDPSSFFSERNIVVGLNYLVAMEYTYTRREMPLVEAARLKYPD